MEPLTIAFICTHNSCRSQMAEGYMKTFGDSFTRIYSAGTEKYHQVKPKAIEAMKLDNIDISMHYPKLLDEIPAKLDILITMGCGVVCPHIPCNHIEDWNLEDPSGGSLEEFIITRDLIKKRVFQLIKDIKNENIKLKE